MKKKYMIYTLSTIPLAITLGNVNESNAFLGLDSFITKTRTVSDVVDIKDKNLLRAINNQLGRGEVLDSVTIADMENLTELNANNREITSISGIENAVNLTHLYLNNNRIENISEISKLTNLIKLEIVNNNISDVSSLKDLPRLSYLNLKDNTITEVNSISNIISLNYLNLSNNNILDVSLLRNLTNLNNLLLSKNNIIDISFLENLSKLTYLDLHENKIRDISSISNLNKIEILSLNKNNISDIDDLRNLSKLRILNLSNNIISNIEPLKDLMNLQSLDLKYNQIDNISYLKNLNNLDTLWLDKNEISDINSLINLNLVTLSLASNNIENINALENQINLKYLSLNSNNISNIDKISSLTNLNELYLATNNILDITAIQHMDKLTNLGLSSNNIEDISALNNLTKLKGLTLAGNNISNISPLCNLTNLTNLTLSSNNISDISYLSEIVNLTSLTLSNNNISDISGLRNLIKLKSLSLSSNSIVDISSLSNMKNLTELWLSNNLIEDIEPIKNLNLLNTLSINGNKIFDLSPIKNLKQIENLSISSQSPILNLIFKTGTLNSDIFIDNPILGINGEKIEVSNISENGIYDKGLITWSQKELGLHTFTVDFHKIYDKNGKKLEYKGKATLNINVVDGYAPESDHTSEFDNNDFGIYTTVTAEDLGTGVDYLMHGGVRQSLPYRFKYDIYNNSNNLVEVYDLVGNKAEYQVKLKDSDIPTIEEGLDALVNKSDSEKEDISYFRKIINDLDESMNKDLLQNRLNDIYPKTLTLDRELTTSNMDVYIKSENILQMALDTNSITFEDFSGVEDIIRENAVNVLINSSLPYQLNAYLPVEIQNADKSNAMDKSILNIKENSESNYQVFPNTTDKIILKDNCSAGNDLVHGVDIKLSGGISHEKDVYKTTIKFEAEQK